MIALNDRLKDIVDFCYYIPGEAQHQKKIGEHHIMFDSMEAVKLYCLAHPFAINMPSMIDPKCKTCYGTGRIGFRLDRENNSEDVAYCPKCFLKNLQKKITELDKKILFDKRND